MGCKDQANHADIDSGLRHFFFGLTGGTALLDGYLDTHTHSKGNTPTKSLDADCR